MKTELAIAVISFALSANAAQPVLVVDRGLPQSNLNSAAGDSRSNIRWSVEEHGFVGDDFTIGVSGETWVIDSIRTWAAPSISTSSTKHLGDLFQDVRLYLGSSGSPLTPIVSTTLTEGSDEADNRSVKIQNLTQNGATPYEQLGKDLRVYQVEFNNLNKTVQGGEKIAFGVWGMGRPVPGSTDKVWSWFNLGSNAALSAAQQDGADNTLQLYHGDGTFDQTFDSNGTQWNKSSDINVQVFAHRAGQ